MGKSLRVAICVLVAVLAGSLIYVLAFAFGMVGHDRPLLNAVMLLIAVIVIAYLNYTLWNRTLLREALVRRFFMSSEWAYDHEIGYAPLAQIVPDGDAFGFVTFAAEALARMSYGFEVAAPPEVFEPQLVIDSFVFHVHFAGDEEDLEDEGVVVDKWEGILYEASTDSKGELELFEISRFDNAVELAQLIGDNNSFLTFVELQGDES